MFEKYYETTFNQNLSLFFFYQVWSEIISFEMFPSYFETQHFKSWASCRILFQWDLKTQDI